MSRDWRLYWSDILIAATKIGNWTADLDQSGFLADERTRDAVLRNLEVIGEAAKRLPPQLKEETPEIEWRKIAAFRDIVAHAYFGIDDDILWDIVSRKTPQLLRAMREAAMDDRDDDAADR